MIPCGRVNFGQFKTWNLVLRSFWWPSLQDYIKDYLRSLCPYQKPTINPPRSPPASSLTSTAMVYYISMDFIVELPCSKGYSVILVVVNLITNRAHFIPCCIVPTAQEMAQLLLENIASTITGYQ